MYDIEFAIPVCGKGKYGVRLSEFKKYGFLNAEGVKVCVKLLVGTETIRGVDEGWPEGFDIKLFKSDRDHVVSKIYDYYTSLKDTDALTARWFAKFDDDSFTDVGGLVKNLDENFDYKRDYYVVTELCKDVYPPEDTLLREMGYEAWVKDPTKTVSHEWEGNVTSQVTMRRILACDKAMEFMRKRSNIPSHVGDIALACAARMVKVYPAEAYFMSKEPLIHKFSLVGGLINHIHFIAPDVNAKQFDLLTNILNGNISNNINGLQNLVSRQYVFLRGDNKVISMVRLNPKGTLEIIDNNNERFWTLQDDELRFLTFDGKISSTFNITNKNYDKIEGKYMFESGVKHMLRSVVT